VARALGQVRAVVEAELHVVADSQLRRRRAPRRPVFVGRNQRGSGEAAEGRKEGWMEGRKRRKIRIMVTQLRHTCAQAVQCNNAATQGAGP
jgi:hypothetical protein